MVGCACIWGWVGGSVWGGACARAYAPSAAAASAAAAAHRAKEDSPWRYILYFVHATCIVIVCPYLINDHNIDYRYLIYKFTLYSRNASRLAGLRFWSTVADTHYTVPCGFECSQRGFCWDPVSLQT